MTTTRSRSLTITVEDTDVRVVIDDEGAAKVSNLPIGSVTQPRPGRWSALYPSNVEGQHFTQQLDAVHDLVRHYYERNLKRPGPVVLDNANFAH